MITFSPSHFLWPSIIKSCSCLCDREQRVLYVNKGGKNDKEGRGTDLGTNNATWGLASQDVKTTFYKGHRVKTDEAETVD